MFTKDISSHADPNVTMLFIYTPEKYHANKETNLLKMYLLLNMVMFNPAMLFSRGCNNLHPQILHPFCYLQCTLDGTTTFKLPTRSLTSGSRLPSIMMHCGHEIGCLSKGPLQTTKKYIASLVKGKAIHRFFEFTFQPLDFFLEAHWRPTKNPKIKKMDDFCIFTPFFFQATNPTPSLSLTKKVGHLPLFGLQKKPSPKLPRTPGISPMGSCAPDFSPSTRVEWLRPHWDDFATSPGAFPGVRKGASLR